MLHNFAQSLFPSARILAVVLITLLLAPEIADAERIGEVADELIVETQDGTSVGDLAATLSSQGVVSKFEKSLDAEDPSGPVVLRVPAERIDAVQAALGQNPKVKSVSKNYIYTADAVPDDPLYAQQWALSKIGAPAGWDVTRGSQDVVIAVLDSGVLTTHTDLAVKLVAGYNAYSKNTDTTDVFGHGTEVAGVAGAVTGNGIGVAGLAWNNMIMPVRITDAKGFGYSSTISTGLRWAVNHGAKVMNISFSQIVGDSAIEAAAKYVRSKGGLVVAAAGNCGCLDHTADSPNILSVAATDSRDQSAGFTSTGSFVDLSAPGVSIYSTVASGGYAAVSGTSFSSPLTAALAALIFSIDPSFTPDEVETILIQNADHLGSAGRNIQFGWGRINAAKSLLAAAALVEGRDITPPVVALTSPSDDDVVKGTVLLSADAVDDTGVANVEFLVDGDPVGDQTTAPFRFSWNSTTISDGSHTLEAQATDGSGNLGVSVSVTVIVANETQGNSGSSSSAAQASSGSGGAGCGFVKPARNGDPPGPGSAAAMMATLLIPVLWQTFRRAFHRVRP